MGESKEKKTKRKKQTINGQPYIVINVKVRPYLDRNGNRKVYKKFYGKTLKECYAKRDKFNSNHGINAREMFFGELADDFICNTFLPDPNFKESTKQRYIDAYNNMGSMHIGIHLVQNLPPKELHFKRSPLSWVTAIYP